MKYADFVNNSYDHCVKIKYFCVKKGPTPKLNSYGTL